MTFSAPSSQQSVEHLVREFFLETVGNWHSERRYYTLKSGDVQEVVSFITAQFLEQGSPDLIQIGTLHNLPDPSVLTCGALITWNSSYVGPGQKQSEGSTVFGVLGDVLYRDRGFATNQPVTAKLYFPETKTMRLRTEYSGSVFEEEIKLIGTKYRTRQTIISRAGEEQMIGQYLERRLN